MTAPPTLTAMTVPCQTRCDRHLIAHAEEIDDLVGHHLLWRQLRDRDVENAANERSEQQKERRAGADAEAGIGEAYRLQNQNEDEDLHQDSEEAGGQR